MYCEILYDAANYLYTLLCILAQKYIPIGYIFM